MGLETIYGMSCRKRKPEISTSTWTSEARLVLPRSARSSQDRDISVKICTGFLSLLCIMNKHHRQTDKQTSQPSDFHACIICLPGGRVVFALPCCALEEKRRKRPPLHFLCLWVALPRGAHPSHSFVDSHQCWSRWRQNSGVSVD